MHSWQSAEHVVLSALQLCSTTHGSKRVIPLSQTFWQLPPLAASTPETAYDQQANQPGSFVVREISEQEKVYSKGREPGGDAQAAMAATSLSREAIRGAVARRAGGVPVRHNRQFAGNCDGP
jgi:hypothetical protein